MFPEPARKVSQRDGGVYDLRMPFLFPRKRHEAVVLELTQRGSRGEKGREQFWPGANDHSRTRHAAKSNTVLRFIAFSVY